MEKKGIERYKKIKCNFCGSGQVYYKIKDKIWQCRNCGETFKFDRKKLGHPQTKETRKKIAKKHLNELNGMWKGDDASLVNIHEWVRRRKPKPKLCVMCKKNKPYDLANISQKYKRDVNDYKWLCRSCHMKEDGRINNLKQFRSKE